MDNFYRDVVLAFNEHKSEKGGVTFHGPQDHGGSHSMHTQLNFFDGRGSQGSIKMNVSNDFDMYKI